VTLSAADLQADNGQVVKKKRGSRDGQAKRRTFTAAYKLAIVEEYEQLTEPGSKGALLRREGLYHSHLIDWARSRDASETRWDSLAKTADVRYRELIGDHPVVPTKAATSFRHDLEPGSLYLRDSAHELHLLRPFLTGEVCPVCRAWSTYHADLVPKGGVQLKSLEHGLCYTSPQTNRRRWPSLAYSNVRPSPTAAGEG